MKLHNDNYMDAYDGNVASLTENTTNAGMQNDAFEGGYPNDKWVNENRFVKSAPSYSKKGYWKLKAGDGNDISLCDETLQTKKNVPSGTIVFNTGNTKLDYVQVTYSGQSYWVKKSVFNSAERVSQDSVPKDVPKQEVPVQEDTVNDCGCGGSMSAEGDLYAAGAVMNKASVALAYKSAVSNIRDLKSAINERNNGAALAYIKNAISQLQIIEKQLK